MVASVQHGSSVVTADFVRKERRGFKFTCGIEGMKSITSWLIKVKKTPKHPKCHSDVPAKFKLASSVGFLNV